MAAAIIPVLTATLPYIPQIVRFVDGLLGRKQGAAKKNMAVTIANTVPYLADKIASGEFSRDDIPVAIELTFQILNELGLVNRPTPTGTADPRNPWPITVVSRQLPGGAIEIVVPEPGLGGRTL